MSISLFMSLSMSVFVYVNVFLSVYVFVYVQDYVYVSSYICWELSPVGIGIGIGIGIGRGKSLTCITVESTTCKPPIVNTQGRNAFLHTYEVSSCILIRYRFTNKRQSRTIKTIALPRLARALLTLIGSCRTYYLFKIKA